MLLVLLILVFLVLLVLLVFLAPAIVSLAPHPQLVESEAQARVRNLLKFVLEHVCTDRSSHCTGYCAQCAAAKLVSCVACRAAT
jgi:hypothetical protein